MKDRVSLPGIKSRLITLIAALALLLLPLHGGATEGGARGPSPSPSLADGGISHSPSLSPGGGPSRQRATHKKTSAKPYDSALLTPSALTAQAPAEFDAKFITTRGNFVIHVTRAWAPLGVDRFYNLMKHRFYNQAGIFRVMPKFVVQFGISAYPEVSTAWHSAVIQDDPVTHSNTYFTVAFATDGPNTRTTQIFINVADNKRLDARGFAPFGKVTEGIRTIRKFYSGYGEEASKRQDEIEAKGRKFLSLDYPKLDSIKSAAIIPGSIVGAPSPTAAAAPAAAPAPVETRPAASAVTKPPAQPRPMPATSRVTPSAPAKPATASPNSAKITPPVRPKPAAPSPKVPPPPKQTARGAKNAQSASGEGMASPESNAPSGGSPTYQQTSSWIVSKVNEAAGHRNDSGDTITYQNISLNGCVLKYREVWHSGYSNARDTYDVTIPLIKLAQVTSREGVVKMTTSTTAVHIARQEKVRGQPKETTSEINVSRTDGTFEAGIFGYVVNLDFRKQGIDAVDVSARVAAALEHASDVCKQGAPKAREPF
jgi:peptidyl-prolyl cis-trans isomerase A (cyclophilin A)